MEVKHYMTNDDAVYSEAIVTGDTIYLSGLVSDKEGIVPETRDILEQMAAILEKYGSSMDKVVRVDVLLTDFSQRDKMNEEYKKHWKPGQRPARVCYGTSALAGKCSVEMIAIAMK